MTTVKKAEPYAESGDMQALRSRLWAAVESAAGLLKSRKPEVRLKAVHATAQAGAAYRNVLETCDLEARIAALEAVKEGDDDD